MSYLLQCCVDIVFLLLFVLAWIANPCLAILVFIVLASPKITDEEDPASD